MKEGGGCDDPDSFPALLDAGPQASGRGFLSRLVVMLLGTRRPSTSPLLGLESGCLAPALQPHQARDIHDERHRAIGQDGGARYTLHAPIVGFQ